MDELLARVDAMRSTAKLWPIQPPSGSGFAEDQAANSHVSTYVVARIQLLEAIRLLETASKLIQRHGEAGSGTHLVILRPALVLTAKAAWVLRPETSPRRVARAVGIAVSDRRMGARAMKDAVDQGAPAAFGVVGEAFARIADHVEASACESSESPLRDVMLIRELATDVDRYYSSSDATSDMQILWNASSGLAHGERWFSSLAGGPRRTQIADTLTARSFDVVCSGINVTSWRLLWHAAPPPP